MLYYNDDLINDEIINFDDLKQIIQRSKFKYLGKNEKKVFNNLKFILDNLIEEMKNFNLTSLPMNIIIDLLTIFSKNGNDNTWENINKYNKNNENFSYFYWNSDIEEINEIKREHNLQSMMTNKNLIEQHCSNCEDQTKQLMQFIQTRSGDEATTVFMTCQKCKTKVKVN